MFVNSIHGIENGYQNIINYHQFGDEHVSRPQALTHLGTVEYCHRLIELQVRGLSPTRVYPEVRGRGDHHIYRSHFLGAQPPIK